MVRTGWSVSWPRYAWRINSDDRVRDHGNLWKSPRDSDNPFRRRLGARSSLKLDHARLLSGMTAAECCISSATQRSLALNTRSANITLEYPWLSQRFIPRAQ